MPGALERQTVRHADAHECLNVSTRARDRGAQEAVRFTTTTQKPQARRFRCGRQNKMKIGSKVKFNSHVAFAFVGQRGVIESKKPDSMNPGRELYVVRMDTPTPAATNWTPLETLAVSLDCMEESK